MPLLETARIVECTIKVSKLSFRTLEASTTSLTGGQSSCRLACRVIMTIGCSLLKIGREIVNVHMMYFLIVMSIKCKSDGKRARIRVKPLTHFRLVLANDKPELCTGAESCSAGSCRMMEMHIALC